MPSSAMPQTHAVGGHYGSGCSLTAECHLHTLAPQCSSWSIVMMVVVKCLYTQGQPPTSAVMNICVAPACNSCVTFGAAYRRVSGMMTNDSICARTVCA